MSWILAQAAKEWIKGHASDYQHLIMVQTALQFEEGSKP